VSSDDPLLQLPNTVLMPHIAWLTYETMARCLDVGLDGVHRPARGEELLHRVV
jgi:phosphoglycerate dehydrogenase-like enzyme